VTSEASKGEVLDPGGLIFCSFSPLTPLSSVASPYPPAPWAPAGVLPKAIAGDLMLSSSPAQKRPAGKEMPLSSEELKEKMSRK